MNRELMNATIFSEATGTLLEANGFDDGMRGIDRNEGWQEIAAACQYPHNARTPAQERYLDGWYKGAAKKNAKRK